MKNLIIKGILWMLFAIPCFAFAQKKKSTSQESQPPYTSSEQRWNGFQQRRHLDSISIVNGIEFRSAGPTVMSGRVSDLEANPDDPTHFYVAYASGGLWYTENNGISFRPVFDHEAALTIGDFTVDWKRKIIWVGTGENNSSRSSYSGVGIYKSSDEGKSWTYSGLPESHHIGRIIVDQENADVLYVAVLGHLYSPNKERGIYKTTDGGKSWKQTLFINENTGCIDIVIDPNNRNILYAAAWERSRRAWNFQESGKGSGIYKSTDGGETWKLITTGRNGFPQGEGAGRIGLACANNNGNTVIYTFVDNQFRRDKKKEEDTSKLTKDQLRTMSAETFQRLDKKKVESFLRANDFAEKYTADTIFLLMKSGKITPLTLVEYLEDANSLLFDTDVVGAELYRSDDGGQTWNKPYSKYMDALFYTYGYYFAQVRVEQNNPNKVYLVGFVILRSDDGGKTFKNINGDNVHVDHHALWLDPKKSGHLINGNDGGVNITYDDGKTWAKCNNPAVGQFYSVNVDMEKPYHIFGGLQDNGVWYGSSDYSQSDLWHQTGEYPYKEIMSGDGMHVAIDTRGNNVVYTGYQFGNYFRCNLLTGSQKYITPRHDLGERPYRWNWQSPIQISVHNQDIIYFGGNKLFRSMNRGDDFKPISADLTKGGKKGDVPYGTITSLHESSLKFGLIYAGTDDGWIHFTKDGGNSWVRISDQLPQDLWVSRIQASRFSEGRVYISLNGYRWDDFNPYLYVSENYGATWTRIGRDLPLEPINVVREDPQNENIIYAGTDNGVYVSLDRGKSFMRMSKGLPSVAVHDLVIHPQEHDIVLGTHGRSIYVASVKELQQLRDSVLQKPLFLFSMDEVTYFDSWGKEGFYWDSIKGPEIKVPLYISRPGKISISIYADSTTRLKEWSVDGIKGLNYVSYDLSFDSTKKVVYEEWLNKALKEEEKKIKLKSSDNKIYYLRPGKYRLVAEANGVLAEKILVIKKPVD